ncbi:polysaccharide deacetylase family protein [Nocardiopsis trehalosi]|uniref:polysaccharide deacetylase family protein n=1 Tax=Nocardiopsis trehalosi TaxID=109329 RepID=UPI00082A9317|nr:polysaccharide deacetylase family protein [Nocardiopsis trehalosi]
MELRIPTHVRAVLSVGAGLSLLALTGCSIFGGSDGGPVVVEPRWINGLEMRQSTASHDGISVSAEHPQIPGAQEFSTELRTLMAENQTAFLTGEDRGDATDLKQTTTFLAASPEVLGARVASVRTAGSATVTEATTRWYDVAEQAVLPWTALFRGRDAVADVEQEVSRVLREDEEVPPEDLPAGLPTADPEPGPTPPPAPAAMPADQAWELADELADSPVRDLGFTQDGDLTVAFPPGTIPGRTEETRVALDSDVTEPLLSTFGAKARTAATAELQRVDLGGSDAAGAPARTLDCDRVPCVALTFDDGPGEHTERLLDELDAYSAKATFYVLGTMVEAMPDVVARAAEEGHEIGGHSWDHDDLATKTGPEVAEDNKRTAAAIEEAAGAPPRTMRPPYGTYSDASLENTDLPVILWDVDTQDWRTEKPEKIVETTVKGTTPGSIVALHDIHPQSVDAVPGILRELHAKGYHFVTVSELFGDGELKAGTTYRRR